MGFKVIPNVFLMTRAKEKCKKRGCDKKGELLT